MAVKYCMIVETKGWSIDLSSLRQATTPIENTAESFNLKMYKQYENITENTYS